MMELRIGAAIAGILGGASLVWLNHMVPVLGVANIWYVIVALTYYIAWMGGYKAGVKRPSR